MQVQSMPLAHDVCGLDRHTSNDAHHTATTTTSSSSGSDSSPEREGEEVIAVVQQEQQEAQPQRLPSQPNTACPLNESTTPRLKSGGKAHGRLHTSSVSQARSNLLQRLRAQRHGEAEAPAKDHTSSTIKDDEDNEDEVVVGAVEVVAAAANEVKAASTQPLQDKSTCGGSSVVDDVDDVNSAKTLHCDPNVATDMQQKDVRRAYKALTTTTTTDDVNDDDESSHSDMGVSSSNSSSSSNTTTTTALSSVHTACWSQEMAQAGQSSLVGVLAAEEELRQQQQRHLVLSHTHEKEDDEEEEGEDRHTSHTHVNEEVEEEEEYGEDGCDPLTRQCTTLCLAAHHCPHNEGCEDDNDDENEDEDHTIITCTAHEGQKEGADVTCAAADDHMSAMPRLTTVRSCDGLDADCALIQCTIQQLADHHPHPHYLNSNTNDDDEDDDNNDGGCCSNRNNNNNNSNSYTHHEESKYSTAYLPQSQAYNNRHYEHNNATASTTNTDTITSDESTCSTNGCSSCNHSCAGADNEEEEEEDDECMNAQAYRDQAAHIARAAEAHQEDAEAEEEEEEEALCVMPAENAWEANVSWQEMSPMAQIRHALRQYPHEHPFLDMRRQVMLYENHRSRQHNLYCLRMSHECMTSAADLLVASKVLVNYGHRLHLERCREHNALVARRRRERQRAGLNRVRQLCPAGGEEEVEKEEEEEEEEGCDGQDTTSPLIVVVGVDEASGKEKECEDEGDEVCGEEEDEETCEEGCKAAAMPNVPATLGAALVECITNTPHSNSEDEYSHHHNNNSKCFSKSKTERDSMKDLAYIHSQWRTLASAMEADLDTDTQHLVQRRLSCMCIFNPNSDERRYTDNEETRERRLQRQQATLMALRLQAEAGGSPYFLS